VSARTRGVVVSAAALLLVAGCGDGAVELDDPGLSAADREACAALVDDLPGRLFGQDRREVSPDGVPGAAWGDPAVELRCGVPVPPAYDEFAACTEVGGVGWFVPQEQLEDVGSEAVATVLTHTPRVELVVPADYRTIGVDATLAELAPVVREHLAEGDPCH
jgi:hypothetical protein